MRTFLLWCLLFALCWPLAMVALVLYPVIWLLLLPFRLLGFAVHEVFRIVHLVLRLPFLLLRAPFRALRLA